MNTPRSGSLAKAWTEVSTPERTMNVPISENPKARIASRIVQAFQRLALFHHDGRMQQRGGDQPGHERRVFDRVPEPEPAPAKLVIGPPGPQRDADGQEQPGGQRPGPHPARPGGIDAALDQRGDGKGERHRKPDIAEVQERRMEGQAGVLQQRVQILPVHRRKFQPQERVRGEQDKGKERHARSADCTDSTRARRLGGRLPPNQAAQAPNSVRISTHSSIEPS